MEQAASLYLPIPIRFQSLSTYTNSGSSNLDTVRIFRFFDQTRFRSMILNGAILKTQLLFLWIFELVLCGNLLTR